MIINQPLHWQFFQRIDVFFLLKDTMLHFKRCWMNRKLKLSNNELTLFQVPIFILWVKLWDYSGLCCCFVHNLFTGCFYFQTVKSFSHKVIEKTVSFVDFPKPYKADKTSIKLNLNSENVFPVTYPSNNFNSC